MPVPHIHSFQRGYPGPYEQNMGAMIVALLRIFDGRVPDSESLAKVTELAMTPDRWSAAHEVFDEIRARSIATSDDKKRTQYCFEELCCKALFNAANARSTIGFEFDPSSPFFVAGAALKLARVLDVPFDAINAVYIGRA